MQFLQVSQLCEKKKTVEQYSSSLTYKYKCGAFVLKDGRWSHQGLLKKKFSGLDRKLNK